MTKSDFIGFLNAHLNGDDEITFVVNADDDSSKGDVIRLEGMGDGFLSTDGTTFLESSENNTPDLCVIFERVTDPKAGILITGDIDGITYIDEKTGDIIDHDDYIQRI